MRIKCIGMIFCLTNAFVNWSFGNTNQQERVVQKRRGFSFHEMGLQKATRELGIKFRESICLEEKQIFTNKMTMIEIKDVMRTREHGVSLSLTNATLDEILNARFNSQSPYQWTRDKNLGIVNIYPRQDAPLDFKIDHVNILNETVQTVFDRDLLQLNNHNISMGLQWGNNSWLNQKVSICATNMSARQVLNVLTSQLNPKMCWDLVSFPFAPSGVGHSITFRRSNNE